MFFAMVTLLTALSIAGIAAWFSILGLMSIFSAQAFSIAIMAGALEVGKLVSASWLYRNWGGAGLLLKLYLTIAVLVLMLITSMGIFGFLSKAHLENTAISSEVTLSITRIDAKITREQQKIKDAETVIGQLDNTVQVLMNNERIRGADGALAVRKGQAEERDSLNNDIDQASTVLASLQDQRLELSQRNLAVEKELGPLKYVAEMIYTDKTSENLDRAVRLFILLLVFVFDPLAVVLLIAANKSLMQHGVVLEKSPPDRLDAVTESVTIIKETVTEPMMIEPVTEPLVIEEPVLIEEPVEDIIKPMSITITEPEFLVEPQILTSTDSSEKLAADTDEQVNISEILITSQSTVSDTTEYQVEPQVREMVEELVQNETTDMSQLQEVAKHLANSKANTSNMTADEIVEVLASSTRDTAARQKLGFWAVKLPDKDI
jgi:hypothetical protein